MVKEEGCSKSLGGGPFVVRVVLYEKSVCVQSKLSRIGSPLNWALAPPFIDQGGAQGYKAYVVYDAVTLMPIKSPGL